MKNLIIIVLIFSSVNLIGQSFVLMDTDISKYPYVTGSFYAIDKNGEQIVNYSPDDFEVFENGEYCIVTDVSCPEKKPVRAISSVLVTDLSGSMGGATSLIARSGEAWVDALPAGKSECALVGFNDMNMLIQDYTTDYNLVKQKLNSLITGGGTSFDAALYNPMASGLKVSDRGKYEKVIILLTDGEGDLIQTIEVKDELQKQNAKLFVVILGMKCTKKLSDLAIGSGGEVYDYITSIDGAVKAFQSIIHNVQSIDPCELTWLSNYNCDRSRNCEVTNYPLNLTSEYRYTLYSENISQLEIVPTSINFGKVEVGETKDTVITIKALNSDFDISNITFSNPDYTVNPASFIIKKGTSKDITLTFSPKSENMKLTEFTVESNPCEGVFFATGGKASKDVQFDFKVTFPDGGEVFAVGADTIISWQGVLPDDEILLELSNDKGSTWHKLSEDAKNLEFDWNDIPHPASDRCLIRGKKKALAWEKCFGGDSAKGLGRDIIQTTDGNYVVAGLYDDNSVYVAKYANDGKIIWEKNFNLPTGGEVDIKEMIQTADGGYALVGDVTPSFQYSLGLFIKLDPSGRTEYLETYPTLNRDVNGRSIVENTDNSYIIVGDKWDPGKDNEGWIMLIDEFGKKIWEKDVNTNERELLYAVTKTRDNNYLAAGCLDPPDDNIIGNYKGWVLVFDINGDIIKEQFIGNEITNVFIDVELTNDGGYIFAGRSSSLNEGVQGWIHKTTADFTTEFTRVYGDSGYDVFASVEQHSDGGYLLSGVIENQEGRDAWIIKTDFVGVKEWEKIVSGAKSDIFFSAIEDNNGNILVCGESESSDGDFASISENGNGCVMKFKYPGFDIEDISDEVFSIIVPDLKTNLLDMGLCEVGFEKDKIFNQFIFNNSAVDCRIDSIYIEGTDAQYFSLIGGFPVYTVPKNDKRSGELRFSPDAPRKYEAEVVIETQASTIRQKIIGEGQKGSIEIINNYIDFGKIFVGGKKDSLNVVTIKNVGNKPIEITKTEHTYPNDKDFTTEKGEGPFTLLPDETAKMDLRFTASKSGITMGHLEFHYDDFDSPKIIQLIGEGLDNEDEMVIRVDSAAAYAGEEVTISIIYESGPNPTDIGATSISTNLIFNPSLLYSYDYPIHKIDNKHAFIKLENLSANTEPGDTLVAINFEIGLGNASKCDLKLDNILVHEATEVPMRKDGLFTLLGICEEGGKRLIRVDKNEKLIYVSPNPSEEIVEIELLLIEKGLTKVTLYNELGKAVKKLFDEDVSEFGKRTIKSNVSELSPGIYHKD
jgi:uncharacterized protein YegL